MNLKAMRISSLDKQQVKPCTKHHAGMVLVALSAFAISACAPQTAHPPHNGGGSIPEAGPNYSGGSNGAGGQYAGGGSGNGSAGSGQGGSGQGGVNHDYYNYGDANDGRNTNNGYNGGGSGQYTPADLRNPSSLLSKRVVYFDYDQATIRPEFRQILDAHASFLKAYPQYNVRLEGHADERGSRAYNQALSERRGYSVLDYMTIKGMRNTQAEVIGFGEEIPVQFGHNENVWSKNRRVEIKYRGE